MKSVKVIIVILAVIAGTAIGLTITNNASGLKGEVFASDARNFDTKTTGSTGSGGALIELTPQLVDNSRLVVKFSINTHSVRLNNHDLAEAASLEYEGKIVRPVKTSRIGGHHSSGKIVFEVGEITGSFKIRINGIPKIMERVYEWNDG